MARKKRTKKHPSPPPTPDTDELCKQLEAMFHQLETIQDVIIVCQFASASSPGELHAEVKTVLRSHAADPLFTQLKELNRIIVAMGGTTSMSDDIDAEDDE